VCDSKQHRPDISQERRAMGGVVNHPDVEASRRHLVDLRLRLERSLNMNYADGAGV
jgi:hypothetical protein